jgi:hypothetical protein
LTGSALAIGTGSLDLVSGAGIVMATNAMQLLLTPVIQSIAQADSTAALTWSGITEENYQAQFSTDLLQTNWTDFGGSIMATNSAAAAIDPAATDPQRFYRVYLLPH